ncbi:MAG: hypothetical protein LBV57_01405 [Candidatus Symbiothrix sp.]|jgi:hypothetical protein|nr:hypothetical protein [Candidatus Symbiothrix sp.]
MATSLLPIQLVQADTAYTMDGGNGKMVFRLNANGTFYLYKKNASGNEIKQMYANYETIFAIKIGNTLYKSGECTDSKCGSPPTGISALQASNVSAVTTGTIQHIAKRYSGTYSTNIPFYVDFRVDYNTSEDRLAFSATIIADAIPAGTLISYAYAFDTYVNSQDAARAITSPDVKRGSVSLNNSNKTYELTPAEVRGLNFIGCINSTSSGGDMLGFYADGSRRFDRAYSAAWSPVGTPDKYLTQAPNNTFDYQVTTDNGIGVIYDNIPTGKTTVIQTSWFIAADITTRANLDWAFKERNGNRNNDKDLKVAVGTPIDLIVNASNLGSSSITGVAYTLTMPTGLPASGTVTRSGFTGGSYSGSSGSTSCSVSGATLPKDVTGVLTIPVSTAKYGQYSVGSAQFSGLAQTVSPSGVSPSSLTVTTEVNYASATGKSVSNGESATYTIKLPTGVTANGDLTAAIGYTGTTTAFSSLPTSVTIPDGKDSATFTLTASTTAAIGASVTATITGFSGSNSVAVKIGTIKAVTTTVVAPPSVSITANPGFIVCADAVSSITFTANPVNGGSAPAYIWKLNGTQVGTGATYTHNDPKAIHKATISCTMTADNSKTASDEKSILVRACSIPVNQNIRVKIAP